MSRISGLVCVCVWVCHLVLIHWHFISISMTKRLSLCTQLFADWKCHLPWINILSEWMSKPFEGEEQGCLYPHSRCDPNRRDLPSPEPSSCQRTHAISGEPDFEQRDRERLKQLVAPFFGFFCRIANSHIAWARVSSPYMFPCFLFPIWRLWWNQKPCNETDTLPTPVIPLALS